MAWASTLWTVVQQLASSPTVTPRAHQYGGLTRHEADEQVASAAGAGGGPPLAGSREDLAARWPAGSLLRAGRRPRAMMVELRRAESCRPVWLAPALSGYTPSIS
jgi:hypothetical protein